MPFLSTKYFLQRTRVLAAANAVMLVVAASAGVAQTGAGKSTGAKAAKPASTATASRGDRSGDVHISSRNRGLYDQAKGIQRLSGDVRVTQDNEDFILYCDELTYLEKTNEAFATGNPRVESRDSTILATKIRADFDNKIIYLEGKVVMKSHGENDGISSIAPGAGGKKKSLNLRGEVLHKPSTLRCNRIDYRYEIQEATLSGDILMRQGDSTGTCERIVFDEANNIAQLKGQVSFTNGDRQTIKARNLTIWIDDNVIETKERVRVDIPRATKDKPKPAAPKTIFPKAPRIDDALKDTGAPPPIPPVLNAPEPDEEAAPTPSRAAPTTEESTPEKPDEAKPEPVTDDADSTSKAAPKETAKAPELKKTPGS